MATPEPEEEGVGMKIILEADLLADVVEALDALVDEAKFQFLQDVIRIWVVDPATVGSCYIDLNASRDEIQHYSVRSQGVEQGLPISGVSPNLNGLVDYTDSGDLLQITWGEATGWKFHFDFPNVDVNVAGIDPDSMRDSPDQPDLDLPYTFRTKGERLKKAIDMNDWFAGWNRIRAGDHVVEFIGKGDTDDGVYDLDEADGDVEFLEHGDEPAASKFSIDYQKAMMKVLKGYDEVTVSLGNDFPMVLETDLFTYMLAPRIEKN